MSVKAQTNSYELIHFLLNQFTRESFKPSLGITGKAVEAGFDRNSTAASLQMMANDGRILKDSAGRVIADERYLEQIGTAKSTAYKLTAYGESERERLGALLERAKS